MDYNDNSTILIPGADKEQDAVQEEDKNVKYRQPRKDRRGKTALIVVLCILGALLIAGGIYGAFRLFGGAEYDNTAQFYFSSNLLSEKGGSFVVYNQIEFTVCNYADELRTCAVDIDSYSVQITAKDKDITGSCKITKELETIPAGKMANGKVTVALPDEYQGQTVDVTVKSSPIEIVLRGEFTVLPVWSSDFTDQVGSVYCKLDLYANDEVVLKVTWDEDRVVADSTNAYVKATGKDQTFYVTLEPGVGAEIYFFKNDINADYSAEEKDRPVTVQRSDEASAEAAASAKNAEPQPETAPESDAVTTG